MRLISRFVIVSAVLLVLLAPTAAVFAVNRLGSWTTGLTHTPGNASNRLLVFAVGYENATDVAVSGVTYGGQALTQIVGQSAGTVLIARAELWYLDEDGIAGASNDSFVVTWGGAAPTNPLYGAATYAGVDQVDPLADFDSDFTNAATPNPLRQRVTARTNSYVVGNYICGNPGDYHWSVPFSEGFDQISGLTCTMSAGDLRRLAPGSVVVDAGHSGPDRQAVVAAVLASVGPNQSPTLSVIGPRFVDEGDTLDFGVLATDPDGPTPILSTSTLPIGATFTDQGNGIGTFDFTPDFTQAGIYNVTFYASDGTIIDSETVTIAVTDVNRLPVLDPISPQSVAEGDSLTFGVSASDPDGTTPTLSALSLPIGATFTDHGDGTGTFVFAPDFTQAGTYDVTFHASDGMATDVDQVTITVINVNLEPVLAAIGPQSVAEGDTLSVGVSASDPDATTPTLSTSTLPVGAAFTDNGDGTGTFDFAPDFTQAGLFNVTIYASDGSATDSEEVVITVTNVNLEPVLAAIGPQSVAEGDTLSVGVSASDPDGTTPTLSTSTLPVGAAFTDNGDGTGTFNFAPDFTQAGLFNVTFYASDGPATDSEQVTITVTNVNLDPVLAAIGPQSVAEGDTLSVGVSASDPDGTTPTLTSSTLPIGAAFTDNGDGTGTFDFAPDFTQAGLLNVTFYASDGSATDSEVVAITVTNVNLEPVLAAIGPQSVAEGDTLSVGVSASDPDGTTPTLTTSTLPTGAAFTDNGDGTGSFDFAPAFTQSGAFNVTFYASDGSATDSEEVVITVTNVNLEPVLAAIGPQSVAEGDSLSVGVSASDPDGTTPTLTTSTLPTGAAFTDNGDGTGTFDFTPDFTQAGLFDVTFYASDGSSTDSEQVTITVTNVNLEPVLAAIGPQSVAEGDTLSVGVSGADPDGTTPGLTTSTLPTGAAFTDNGDGTGTFEFTPDFTQAGLLNVTFYASDGSATDSEEVAIAVTNVNLEPVLAAIGPQSVAEGDTLSVGVSASDPDGTTPTLTTSTLPFGAAFTDNGDGTGTFDFAPDFTQAGLFNVTFYATDGSATDSEQVTITVTGVNQDPVLAAIGPQSVAEGDTLSVGVSASDPDGNIPGLTTSTLPVGAAFTDNGDATGTFDFAPDFTQAGLFNVTFYASDGSATDSEQVTITVTGVNQDPVLAAIGPQSVAEGDSLSFGVSAVDADGTTPSLTTSTLPVGAAFTDNGDGTGSFDFAPDFTQAGLFNVTFYASDGSATDSEVVVITVTNVNLEPVLAAIGSQSVAEGDTLTVGVSASDPDGTTPSLTTSTLPVGAAFTDNGDGTGTFDFAPDFTQSGTYDVTFYASDGSVTDSEQVTITVTNVNLEPVLAAIGPQSVAEGDTLTVGVSASDPDGTTPSLSTSTLPTGAAFTDNGDGTGTFDFTPDFTQAGLFNVTFYASDGSATDSEEVAITVTNVNLEPVLAAIGPQSVAEGDTLSVGVSAGDPDGTTPSLTTSTLPIGAAFTDNGDGTGTFDFTPDFTQSGSYDVTFYASDGSATDSEEVVITVTGVNQEPVLAAIGPQSVAEGDTLSVGVSASDLDGTTPSLSTSTLPVGAAFTDNGDGTGTFDFAPDFTQAGLNDVTFYASDGSASDSEQVTITVTGVNLEPVLAAIGPQSVAEGDTLSVGMSASDPDGTTTSLSTSTLPVGAAFTDNGDGTGTFDFAPDFTQAGLFDVTFYASDGSASDSEQVTITVTNVNLEPVLAAIGPQSVAEGDTLSVGVSASDPDGTTPSLTTSTLPVGAAFTDNGDGTGTFDFTPDFAQAGTYDVTFYASDGSATDSEQVTITVTGVNLEPVLAAIGPQSVAEGDTLNVGVSASDPDGTTPTLTTSTLPVGAAFTDNGDGTGTFDFAPDFTQAGLFNVTFYASDGSATDSEEVVITVTNVNLEPVLAAIGPQSVSEGDSLSFGVSAIDADGTTPSLTTSTLPVGAAFTDNGDGTGSFEFAPDFTQSGSYDVTFYASDGSSTDSEQVTITVTNVNLEPVLAAIGPQSVAEGDTLSVGVSANDPDGTTPSLTTSTLPVGAAFTDNGDGTGSFDFAPDFTQAGTHDVTFYASDGSATDSEQVTITVTGVNLEPVLAAIGPQSVAEGDTLSVGVSASDPDATTPALTTSTLPVGAAFTDNGDGTGSFDFAPDFTQSGSYDVTFYAADGSATDSEQVTITVTNVNMEPVLAAIGPQSVAEGDTLSVGVSASDPDATTPALTTSTLPVGAAFTDNGDGTGSFDFAPDFTQAGSYDVTFYAADGSATDSEQVTITVTNVNLEPALAAIGPQSVAEGDSLSVGVSASDPDGTTPTLTTSTLPTGAAFTDNGDGTGTFDFAPDFTQAGLFNVTFYASDGSATDSEAVVITVFTNAPVTISGNASVAGATLTYVIDSTETATADGTGFYSFSVPYNWSGTVIPSLTGYMFIPDSLTYVNVTSNLAGQDYQATPNVAVDDDSDGLLPNQFALSQNFPNPFNPTTTISFALPEASDVTVDIFNSMGQRVAVLVQGRLAAGEHQIQWDGRGHDQRPVSTGVYFYRLQAGDFAATRKMLLLK